MQDTNCFISDRPDAFRRPEPDKLPENHLEQVREFALRIGIRFVNSKGSRGYRQRIPAGTLGLGLYEPDSAESGLTIEPLQAGGRKVKRARSRRTAAA